MRADCFGGIGRLYGVPVYHFLTTARVAIVGIGGVGSWVAEALARSGVGTLILMDLDDICVTNTNRQIHAMQSTIGQMKVEAMATRIHDICPETEVIPVSSFYTEKNADKLYDLAPDVVVDAIDAMVPKTHLIATCYRKHIPIVTCGGAGGRKDASKIRVADLSKTQGDPLLARLRRNLRVDYGLPLGEKARSLKIPCAFSEEKPVYPTCDGGTSCSKDPDFHGRMACDAGFGSATHITGTFGFLMAGAVLEKLEQLASQKISQDNERAGD